MKRARYFIVSRELPVSTVQELQPGYLRKLFTDNKNTNNNPLQLAFDWGE